MPRHISRTGRRRSASESAAREAMRGWDGDEPDDDQLALMFGSLLGRRLALCVSGGADSVALMHLVARWATLPVARAAWREAERNRTAAQALLKDEIGPAPPSLEVQAAWMDGISGASPAECFDWPAVVVLTVDHGLRPDSAAEAEFVSRQATALGFPHQTLVWTGDKPKTGLQQAARAARYGLLHSAVEAECWAWRRRSDGYFGQVANGAAPTVKRALVTAHNLEDQAETFLMRLARGTTIDGLSSMRSCETFWGAPRAGRSYRSPYQVLRPLLSVSRLSIERYLACRGVEWREDPSNANPQFERVRVRSALPVLEGLGIAPARIAATVERLAIARESLEAQVEDAVRACLVSDHGGLYGHVRGSALSGQPLDRVVRVLRYLLAAFGGGAEPAAYDQIVALAGRIRSGQPVVKQTLAGCMIAAPARMDLAPHDFLVWREAGRLSAAAVDLQPGAFIDWDGGRFRVTAAQSVRGSLQVRPLGANGSTDLRSQVPSLRLWRVAPGSFDTLPAIWDGSKLVAVPYLDAPLSAPSNVRDAIAREWRTTAASGAAVAEANFGGHAIAGARVGPSLGK
jgi:tRNA(Ile)-lysidine synthase